MGYYRKRKKTKRRKKLSVCNINSTLALRLLLLFAALFLIALAVKNIIVKRQANEEPPFDMIFDESETITYYNHYNECIETKPLDEYIFHVVAAEMPASYGIEALKAQAVAARTYAVSHMSEYMGDKAGYCSKYSAAICTDSSCCQAWKSFEKMQKLWGRDYDKYCKKIYEAVIDTHDIIATYDNKPIDALYHSCSGGYTENSENVYTYKMPYLRGVKSPNENSFEKTDFTKQFSYSDICNLLNKEFKCKLTKSNIKKNFVIKERYKSGRVEKVEVGDKTVTGRDIRRALSLRSANFTVEFTKKNVVIKTVGYGHGVGMSQAGAAAMAYSGKSYTDILTHYYTDITLVSIKKDVNNSSFD